MSSVGALATVAGDRSATANATLHDRPDESAQYNQWNYWKWDLPDVGSEITYWLGSNPVVGGGVGGVDKVLEDVAVASPHGGGRIYVEDGGDDDEDDFTFHLARAEPFYIGEPPGLQDWDGPVPSFGSVSTPTGDGDYGDQRVGGDGEPNGDDRSAAHPCPPHLGGTRQITVGHASFETYNRYVYTSDTATVPDFPNGALDRGVIGFESVHAARDAMGNLQAGESKKPKGLQAVAATVHSAATSKDKTGSPRIMRMFNRDGSKATKSGSGAKGGAGGDEPAAVQSEALPIPTLPALPRQPSFVTQVSPPTTLNSSPFATPPSNNTSSSESVFADTLTASPADPGRALDDDGGGSGVLSLDDVLVKFRTEPSPVRRPLNLQWSEAAPLFPRVQPSLSTSSGPRGSSSSRCSTGSDAEEEAGLKRSSSARHPPKSGSHTENGLSGSLGAKDRGGVVLEDRISATIFDGSEPVSGEVVPESDCRVSLQTVSLPLLPELDSAPLPVSKSASPELPKRGGSPVSEAELPLMGPPLVPLANGAPAQSPPTPSTSVKSLSPAAFTVTKHKKINLSSPATTPSSVPSTPCTPGSVFKRELTSSEQALICSGAFVAGQPDSAASLRRHSSYGDVPFTDQSNVLRKVASLTLDRATIEEKVNKPKFVPEKLDFKIYEKFEGQMLINWFCSTFAEGHYLHYLLSKQDLKIMAAQFCTHLLACGVLRQIEDAEAPLESLFRPDLMYYWAHSETQAYSTPLPGKLRTAMWPPYLPEGEEVGLRFPSKMHLEIEALSNTLKEGYREELEKIQRDAEASIQRLQKEHDAELASLQEKLQHLEREVEKYKTLADIEALKNQVNADFSPVEPVKDVTSKAAPVSKPPPPPPPPPPPLPISDMGLPCSPPPPLPGMGPPPPPPPPPLPGMGPPPPPPPLPGLGGPPPPPPMPGMGPPLPPQIPGKGGPPPPPPPPGSTGPVPLPPPPPGGWYGDQRSVLRKLPITPRVPMKPLYWTRIQVPLAATVVTQPTQSCDVNNNIWAKIEEVNLDTMDEFIDLFSRQVIEKKVTAKKSSSTSKLQRVKLLDSKRAQMVGILVSSLHLEISEVENAIYNFDTSVLDLDTLQAIYEVRANDEELNMIKTHLESNPNIPVDKPEQFLFDLSQIPHFADRIACFTFQSTFQENMTTLENKLNNMKMTCKILMKSEEVQRILGMVLTLGNYMNGGNRQRGQADGFGLEILPKLRDVKSKDNSLTLLHYIVKVYVRKFDEHAGNEKAKLPLPEPSDLEKASCVKFDDLAADLKNLRKDLSDCSTRADKVITGSKPDHLEPFKSNMEEFFQKAKKECGEQDDNLGECQQVFEEVKAFFQWVPKSNDEALPKDFFAAWITFCSDFKDIWKKEQQRVAKERLEQAVKMKLKQKEEETKALTKAPKEKSGLKSKLARKRAT